MRKEEIKLKKQRSRPFRFLKTIFRAIKQKPVIINLNETLEDNAIFIANHSAASGPLTYELYFPKYFFPWGTHEMCGNYRSRWRYLYHTFYRQKLHYNKVKSWVLATLFAMVSRIIYRATGLIGTYSDARLVTTFRHSIAALDNNIPLLIFPENSKEGYHEVLTEYHKGFIALSRSYYKKRGVDLPIYNIYYSKEHNKMVIDKPIYLNSLMAKGKTEESLACMLKNRANELFTTYIKEESLRFDYAYAILFDSEKFWCIKTLVTDEKKEKPVFSLIGGAICNGETAEECIIREYIEKIGIEVKPIKLQYIFEDTKGARHACYICRKSHPDAIFEEKPREIFQEKSIPYKLGFGEFRTCDFQPKIFKKALLKDMSTLKKFFKTRAKILKLK